MIFSSLTDVFRETFFIFDYLLAIFTLVVVLVLYFTKKIDKYALNLFFLGFLLGLAWEIPIGLIRELGIPFTTINNSKHLLPFPFHSIMHSIWDGGLFLIGGGFIWLFNKDDYFDKFNRKELIILIVWGQTQNFLIELGSLLGGGWKYIPYWWNPSLFTINGHPFTLIPQLIWLIACIPFYFIAIRIKRDLSTNIQEIRI